MNDSQISRHWKETALETTALTFLMLIATWLPVFSITLNAGGYKAVQEWTVTAGKTLYEHLGWALAIYLSTLLAFYAVSIGGQLLGGTISTTRIRRTLGIAAELITAAVSVPTVFVVVYCLQDVNVIPMLYILIPIVCIIVFLSLQLGSFVIFDISQRLIAAEQARDHARRLMLASKTRHRSQHNFILTSFLNVLAITTSGLVLAGWANISANTGVVFCVFAMISTLLLAADCHCLYIFRTTYDKWTRALSCIVPAILNLSIIALSIFAFALDAVRIGCAFCSIVILSSITTLCTRLRIPRKVFEWSMNAAVARIAARSITKRYVKAVRLRRDLLEPLDAEAHTERPTVSEHPAGLDGSSLGWVIYTPNPRDRRSLATSRRRRAPASWKYR